MLAVKCALLLFGGEILPRVRNVTHEKRVLHRSSFRRMIFLRLAARLSSLRRHTASCPAACILIMLWLPPTPAERRQRQLWVESPVRAYPRRTTFLAQRHLQRVRSAAYSATR